MKKSYKRLLMTVAGVFVCLSLVLCISPRGSSVPTVTQNQRNMVARADYYYGITWVAQQTTGGWGSTFYQGNTYRIPYGQPIMSGKYVGYGATFEEFLNAANTAGSIFYTGRSWCDGTTAPYYASDCSSFVSWVWGIARTTTYYIPGVSTNLGSVTTNRATYTLQLGDALNSNAHVVLVSGLDYDANGAISKIEITEQTPPQMKRSYYTPSQLSAKYGSYTIQRYYGEVPVAPDHDEEAPVITEVTYSNVSAAGYTISCKVTDNVGVYRVSFPTWTTANGQDDLAANFMSTQQGTKNGNIYTFRVNASDHNNEGGKYATHIYAEDNAGNVSCLTPPAVEVRNDDQKPVISNVRYSNVSEAGYTITCTVTDDWGVNSVAFPTWTTTNGQDDLAEQFMITQRGTRNGNDFTFRVNASDHNNETQNYVTHIYATDCAGNQSSLALQPVQLVNDTQKPEIVSAEIFDVSASGYTVRCTVTDDWGINRVAFPTWTVANGQDDLPAQFINTQLGTRDGNTFTFRVNASDHNNEQGVYVTHIYAVDCAGNQTSLALQEVNVQDRITLKGTSSFVISQGYVLCGRSDASMESILTEFVNDTLEVVDLSGEVVAGDRIMGTGMRIILVVDGELLDEVTVVIMGDVDGDGGIDAADYGLVKAFFLEQEQLQPWQLLAADVDRNSEVDTTDYQRLKAHVMGTEGMIVQ